MITRADLSRFGRNYLEVGQYLEIKYPTLGIRFIAIQDNVDSESNTGTELMPFSNIFNEWHAASTSKKVRAVWASKAAQGKRVSHIVPYGYVRDKDDIEVWHIDEEAAVVVRRIYDLCLSGKGPSQIAKILEAEKIPTPSEHFIKTGRNPCCKITAIPYGWSSSCVADILDNRVYTGCAVNHKSTRVSYKVHKLIFLPEEEHQIIPDMHEAIISEEVWLRVHERRSHKHRHTKYGLTSIFSGSVFCADCGKKMYFMAPKKDRKESQYFACSGYKSGRHGCTSHYIRENVLKTIVLESISRFVDFVRSYESVFVFMLEQKHEKAREIDIKRMKRAVENSKNRIAEIDMLIERIY